MARKGAKRTERAQRNMKIKSLFCDLSFAFAPLRENFLLVSN
jgi:hypothetical protein